MKMPRMKFAYLPTPIEGLPRLSTYLGGPSLFVKRDDLTGVAMGGNKIRKLEFVLADALAHGAKTLVTVGALQSNHCRQTAAMAARLEMNCVIVLSGDPFEKPSGNLLLDYLFNARIIWAGDQDRNRILDNTFEQLWIEGSKPYKIPLGASTPVGTMGYVNAFQEYLKQEADIDWMVVASSSGATQAGLILGALQNNWKGKILGISVDLPEQRLKEIIIDLVNQASDRLGEKYKNVSEKIHIDDSYIGEGYGKLAKSEIAAIKLFAQKEGLVLDPVYTGRAAAGMIDLIHKGMFKKEDRILFWHTGGTPALFAEGYQNQLVITN